MDYEDLKDWKYRVLETFTVHTDIKPEKRIQTKFSYLEANGDLTIEKGFCWDGPTGGFDTRNTMLASLLHDAGCNWRDIDFLSEKEIEQFDDLFEEYLYKEVVADNMKEFRAKYMVAAVRLNTKIKFGV